MIERYLHQSNVLKAVFLLIDIRHDPSANDKTMYEWILANGFHPIIIATKADKINRSQLQNRLRRSGRDLAPGKIRLCSPSLHRRSRGGRRFMK